MCDLLDLILTSGCCGQSPELNKEIVAQPQLPAMNNLHWHLLQRRLVSSLILSPHLRDRFREFAPHLELEDTDTQGVGRYLLGTFRKHDLASGLCACGNGSRWRNSNNSDCTSSGVDSSNECGFGITRELKACPFFCGGVISWLRMTPRQNLTTSSERASFTAPALPSLLGPHDLVCDIRKLTRR